MPLLALLASLADGPTLVFPPGPDGHVLADSSEARPLDLGAAREPAAGDRPPHVRGTPTALYINFDGVALTACEPSSAALDCSSLYGDRSFPPFSGGFQAELAIVQAARRLTEGVGIRITTSRPIDRDDYTMVVYGGQAGAEQVLGRAPGGDCGDRIPGQIAFAFLDGPLRGWVNGGATTAVHEAAHTWGLDHVDAAGTLMYPTGDNAEITLGDGCAVVVADSGLTPGGATCPDDHARFCPPGQQDARAELLDLFGPGYFDLAAPRLTLRAPEPGARFLAPGSFSVEIGVEDDFHPQRYGVLITVDGIDQPYQYAGSFDSLRFDVGQLAAGAWTVHVRVTDEAGHAAALDFAVEVAGDETGCRAHPGPLPLGSLLLWCRRRRRAKGEPCRA